MYHSNIFDPMYHSNIFICVDCRTIVYWYPILYDIHFKYYVFSEVDVCCVLLNKIENYWLVDDCTMYTSQDLAWILAAFYPGAWHRPWRAPAPS